MWSKINIILLYSSKNVKVNRVHQINTVSKQSISDWAIKKFRFEQAKYGAQERKTP
jgi:hypothetical protein